MLLTIPNLRLTQGQVAWVLSQGQEPTKRTIDQLRYLRQVSIPFAPADLGGGRGHHLRYGFDQLIQCGLALYSIRRGMMPGEVADYLIAKREVVRQQSRLALEELPEDVLKETWVRSRGRSVGVRFTDIHLRMHNRYSEQPGEMDFASMEKVMEEGGSFGDLQERFPDDESRLWVPLTRLVLEWTAWALEAPPLKRGRA